MRAMPLLLAALLLPLVGACAGSPAPDEHADHPPGAAGAVHAISAQDPALPPGAAGADARLAASPRHGEWVMVPASAGDSVRAWVVYPERADPAPVVLVVHEIYGLSDWIRSVADQLAADGFIAIAPDLLTGKNVPEGPDGPVPDSARAAIRTLLPADVQRRLDAVASYGMDLPAAEPRYGIVGFCWGGSTAFANAGLAAGKSGAVAAPHFHHPGRRSSVVRRHRGSGD
jgi:carboxymethylenebutenolidase